MDIQQTKSSEEPSMDEQNFQPSASISHGALLLTAEKITLAEEPGMSPKQFITSGHGSLLLTAEKITLAEEIKILIRKLWD